MSIINKNRDSQEGMKINYTYLMVAGILFIFTHAIVAWLSPDLIMQRGIYKSIDRTIKFYPAEIEVELNLDNASAIHNIKITAVSENLNLEMCNDANLLEFQMYNFIYDSILHRAKDAEIISTTVEDIEFFGPNKKYTLRLEIKSKCLSRVEYASIIGNNKKVKIGHFKICIPYSNGTTRDSSIITVPIILQNIDR